MREERRLTFEPWPGQVNNGRLCLETLLVLARLTGRTLVWPRGYRKLGERQTGSRWIPPDPAGVLDVGELRKLAPIDFESREERGARAAIRSEPGTAVFCIGGVPPPRSPGRERLLAFAAGRRRFLSLTPALARARTLHFPKAPLEPFYAFYFFGDETKALEARRLVARHVVYRPEIVSAARRAARALGRFSAVHVRRDDFGKNYPSQKLSAAAVLASLRRRVEPGSRLYVATDEPRRAYFAPLARDYELAFLDDVKGKLPPDAPREWLGCVEQLICAAGDTFVGTRYSTFSSYVTRLRGLSGAKDAGIYFTDGYPGSALDGFWSPPYSWQNWLRFGSPLWAREYPEGWTLRTRS